MRYITYGDRTQTLRAWAEELGITRGALRMRLRRGIERTFAPDRLYREGARVTYQGRTQSLGAWARELDVPYTCLSHRYREGWPVERLLSPYRETTGPGPEHRRASRAPRPHETIEFQDRTLTVTQWAKELGVTPSTIRRRHRRGIPIDHVHRDCSPITFMNRTMTIQQWSGELGIPAATIAERRRRGLPPQQVLSTERLPRLVITLTYQGRTLNIHAWAAELGLPIWLVIQRYRKGWPVENVLSTRRFRKRGDYPHKAGPVWR